MLDYTQLISKETRALLEKEEEQKSAYRKEHRERLRNYKKEWVKTHRSEIAAYQKVYYSTPKGSKMRTDYRKNNRELLMFLTARKRAVRKNIPFTITVDDLIIPDYCKYLGIKLEKSAIRGCTETSPSLDRVDNTLGYIKENLQVISNKANRMKNNASVEELLTFARNIIKIHG